MAGSDLVTHLVRFAGALRADGIEVRVSDEIDGAVSLTLIDLADRAEVHHALVAALKIRPRDRGRFDALFDAWWRDQPAAAPGRETQSRLDAARRRRVALPVTELLAVPTEAPSPTATRGDTPGYSAVALLKRKSFDEWSSQDLVHMEALLARVVLRLATRRSRRFVPTRGRGMADLRRSFRHSLGTSGELFSLARKHRPIERPRLVLLCDTSGSMDPHTRFLLAFVLSLRRATRAVELFAFNTTLTRLTRWLKPQNVPETLDRFAAEVSDWSGGTRIGECLAAFVHDHLASMVNRKTVVVILSDGLDRGDPDILRQAMRAIHDAARKVIWLNPLMGDARYEPTARGMAAALPFVDRLAAAHNLESLERIAPFLML